jgi:hypothetical protein
VRAGGLVIAAASLGLALSLARGATTFELRAASAIFGVGMGLTNTAQVIAVQTCVTFKERGVATASTMFFRSIGGTIGVGVMGAVLARTLLANAVICSEGGAELVGRILGPDRRTVPVSLLAAVAGDLQLAIARVSWICVAVACLALVAGWLFPRVELANPADKPA